MTDTTASCTIHVVPVGERWRWELRRDFSQRVMAVPSGTFGDKDSAILAASQFAEIRLGETPIKVEDES